MSATFSSFPETAAGSGEKPDFKVVLIYEDLAAGKRGQLLYEQLVGSLHGDCTLTQNLWNFNVLAIPAVRNVAATSAAAADLVILSMSGKRKLSAKVKDWANMWVWLIDHARPALVTLFEGQHRETTSIVAFLRSVAASKRIDLFDQATFLPAV